MDQNFVTLLLSNMKEIKKDIKDLDSKVESVLKFKWQIMGGALVLSGLLTIALQIALALIQRS